MNWLKIRFITQMIKAYAPNKSADLSCYMISQKLHRCEMVYIYLHEITENLTIINFSKKKNKSE